MTRINKHTVIFLIIVALVLSVLSGCNTIPTIPGTNPNPGVNPENSEVSYIEVTSSASTMQTGETMQFVVKGYNSDSEQVIIDKSKIILWKRTVTGVACPACVYDDSSVKPTSNSLTTTFSSSAAATFHIAAYYKEDAEAETISDYSTVLVTSKAKTIYDINPKSNQ